MKLFYIASAAVLLSIGVANAAESMNKTDDPKQSSPGSTGAMNNVTSTGVATDPGAVQAQSGNTKASPGTVGAAPAADTPSQIPKK